MTSRSGDEYSQEYEEGFGLPENSGELVSYLESEEDTGDEDGISYTDIARGAAAGLSIYWGYHIATNPVGGNELRDLTGHASTATLGAVLGEYAAQQMTDEELGSYEKAGYAVLGGLGVDGSGQAMQELGLVSGSFNPETWVFAGLTAGTVSLSFSKLEEIMEPEG